MAVEIGTATGYLDLLDKLKIFLTTNATLVAAGQEWTCLRDDGSDMIFQGPGLSTTEEIFIGMKPYDDAGADIYSWDIASFTGYTEGNAFDLQPGREVARSAFLPLWDDSIPYWFIGNGQRIVVIAKVSTTYQSMYLGKFLPYATPGQYPYPVFCGGMTNSSASRFSAANIYFFPQAYAPHCYVYSPSGQKWLSGGSSYAPGANIFNIWPFCEAYASVSVPFAKMAPFDNGDVTLMQSVLRYGQIGTSEMAVLGELDGIFWVHGTGQSSESIVTIDSEDYLVFQDGGKTEVNKYAAVRLV